jgi:hypothetical protein
MPFPAKRLCFRVPARDFMALRDNQFHIIAQYVPVQKLLYFGTRRLVSQVIDTAAIVARVGRPGAASSLSFHAN